MENQEIKQEIQEVEAIEAEKQEKKIDKYSVFEFIPKTPIKYEDKTYAKIIFDFGKLKGTDAVAIEEEMESQNSYALAPETSKVYQAKMAARAGRVPSDLIESLNLQDFNRITNAARNFLLGVEL